MSRLSPSPSWDTTVNDNNDPLYVFYNYHSIPVGKKEIDRLLHHLNLDLGKKFTRLFFVCDVRRVAEEITDDVEARPNCEILHIFIRSKEQFEETMGDRMRRVCGKEIGTFVLITNGGSFVPLLTELTSSGWNTKLFHPLNNLGTALLNVVHTAKCLPLYLEGERSSQNLRPSPTPVRRPSVPPHPTQKKREKKRSSQCPRWNEPQHSNDVFCPLFHPEKTCMFFPQCRSGAEKCKYAHPFCSDGDCFCEKADVQLNHFSND